MPSIAHAMPNENVFFDRSQVAQILRVSLTSVRNWSNGTTIRVRPSVYFSRKPGTPSFYNERDVQILALAKALLRLGLSAKTAQAVLDEGVERFDGAKGLLLDLSDEGTRWEWRSPDDFFPFYRKAGVQRPVICLIDLNRLRWDIGQRIAGFLRKEHQQ